MIAYSVSWFSAYPGASVLFDQDNTDRFAQTLFICDWNFEKQKLLLRYIPEIGGLL